MGELDAGIKCVEFVHWRVNISEGFVEGTKRIEMIWAAEEYHLRCVIYGHYRELYQLRAQKNATEDEITAVSCARAHDAVCVGAVDVEFLIKNGTQFNAYLLDAGYVSSLHVGYDVAVAHLACAEGEFLNRGACSPCSACPPTAYMLSPCTNVSDIVCQPCITCAPGTYEVCLCDGAITSACPTRNRLCYA